MADSRTSAVPGMRVFTLVWLGQLVSLIGSGLTGFALGVWTYQTTGSVVLFSFILLFTRLPSILIAPIAGVLVDRWDRRLVMLVSDTAAALSTLGVAVMVVLNRLEVWHIYVATTINATSRAFQEPAYTAATSLLVPPEQYGRASGMVQTAEAMAEIVAPLLAGVLVATIQLQGVMTIDFVTFLFAVGTLLITRFPRPKPSTEGAASQGSFWQEATYGWRYIIARPGLTGLLGLFTAVNFAAGFINVLLVPLILSFTTTAVLGVIMSVSGVGLLLGSLTMSAWGGPKQRIFGVLGAMALMGLALLCMGLIPNPFAVGAAAFAVLFVVPFTYGCSQAIWQSKVPPDVQGRVFATQRMIAISAMPISILLGGPLADQVFNPLLVEGGSLANSVGLIIGVGPGRGIGLIYVIMGSLITLLALFSYLYPRLRLVEKELPDAIPATPPAGAEVTV